MAELGSDALIFVLSPCSAGKNFEWINAGFFSFNRVATSLVILPTVNRKESKVRSALRERAIQQFADGSTVHAGDYGLGWSVPSHAGAMSPDVTSVCLCADVGCVYVRGG